MFEQFFNRRGDLCKTMITKKKIIMTTEVTGGLKGVESDSINVVNEITTNDV